VAGQDADEGDTPRARDPAGDGELEGVRGCRPDHRIAVERGEAAVELEDQALQRDGLIRHVGVIERLAGHLTVSIELIRRDGPQGIAISHAATCIPSAARRANPYPGRDLL